MLKRFVTFDRAFQIRIAVIVVLLLLISAQGRENARQEKVLTRVLAEQALVAKLPDMKAALAARAAEAAAPQDNAAVKVENGFHLQGVLLDRNDVGAMVNGELKVIGDVVGKYEIVQITAEGVAVADREANTLEVIPLPDAK